MQSVASAPAKHCSAEIWLQAVPTGMTDKTASKPVTPHTATNATRDAVCAIRWRPCDRKHTVTTNIKISGHHAHRLRYCLLPAEALIRTQTPVPHDADRPRLRQSLFLFEPPQPMSDCAQIHGQLRADFRCSSTTAFAWRRHEEI